MVVEVNQGEGDSKGEKMRRDLIYPCPPYGIRAFTCELSRVRSFSVCYLRIRNLAINRQFAAAEHFGAASNRFAGIKS